MTDTKQTGLTRDKRGRITGGTPPAGFNKRPENRSDGRWKKEDSISYNYNLFLAMDEVEFDEFAPKTKAQRIAYNRVKEAAHSLYDVKEITDRTEGKAPQSVDVTTAGESINPYAGLTTDELRRLAK